MRKKKLFGYCKMTLDLQRFADGDGAGAGDNGGGSGKGSGSGEGAGDSGDGSKSITFEDFLKDEENQAEFDRRMQQEINTAVTNAQQKWQAFTDDKLSEAEKLAQMNKEEKSEYLQQKKERELSAKEAALTKRELTAEAKNTLAEKKLPVGLAEVLSYTDADSCNKSIDVVEKAFQEAVESAVQDRLKGGATIKKANSNTETLESEVAKAIQGNY